MYILYISNNHDNNWHVKFKQIIIHSVEIFYKVYIKMPLTLWHKSQQDPLWPTSQDIRNKSKNKQMGPN